MEEFVDYDEYRFAVDPRFEQRRLYEMELRLLY